MEGALQQGAGYNNAFTYGILSGATEAAMEKLGGYAFGDATSLLGKTTAGTKFGAWASKGLGKAITGAVSEGVEELGSDFADPVNKWITGVDTEIGANFREAVKNIPRTFAMGATVGGLMQGGQVLGQNISNKSAGRGGAKATRADSSLAYVSESAQNYGKNEAQNRKTDKAILQGLTDVGVQTAQMSESERAVYRESLGEYKNAFNEDGSIKQDLEIADVNTEAISRKLKPISLTLKHAPISSNEQISEGASQAKAHIEKVLGSKANVVITNSDSGTNAFYNPGENVFYINNNSATLNDADGAIKKASLQVSFHEMTHSAEGTRQYNEFVNELNRVAMDENAPDAIKKRVGSLFDRELGARQDYAEQTKGMSKAQARYTFDTEVTADLSGDLMADDYIVNKLAERNAPLVKKLISRFKGTIKKSATVDSESIEYLKKLVSKFEKALDNAQGGVKISQIGNADDERKETADSSQQIADSETNIRFSKNKEEYPYSMQTVIKEYIDSVDEKILKAAENLRENKNDSFVRQKICDVDFDFIAEVKDIFDLNVDKFTVNINSNAFNHIEKRHGLNGEADKSMANLKDLARIGYVIQNRDSLEPLYLNGEQVYSKEFSTKEGTPAPLMLLKKKINGTYYCAIAVTDGKYEKVWVQTAFINKRDGLTQILHDEISSLSQTSETVPASHPSNNSITENSEKDNSFDENNSKNVSNERKSVKRSYEPGKESEFEERLEIAEQERQESFNQLMAEQLEEMQSLIKNRNESFEQILSARYGNIPVTDEFENSEAISIDEADRDRLDSFNQQMSEKLKEVRAFDKERRELEAQLLKRNDNVPVAENLTQNEAASLESAERDRLESVKQLMNEKLEDFKNLEMQRKELEAQLLGKKENVPVTEEFENNEAASLDSVERERLDSFSQQMQEMLENTQSLLNNDASIVDAIIEQEKIYDSIVKMPSVRQINGTEFAKGEVDLVTQVDNYFATYGNKVTNEHLGDVLIDRRGIKDDIAHGIGRKKAAAFVAVPDVIQKGKIVDYQKNWKGRGYDTAVIVAPVNVIENSQENRYFMGVVVIQNKENNRFYVHEVASIKKEGMQPFKTSLAENNSNAGGDTPSIMSILQKIVNYNNKSQKSRDFTRKMDIRELLSEVLENYAVMDEDNDSVVFISKDAKDDIISSIWKKVNSTSKFSKKKFASLMADKILENTILADSKIYDADKLLKGFMHRIDLSSVADQIGSDIKRKINARWALKEGQEAISINNIVQALNTKVGVQISAQDLLGAVTEINSLFIKYC